MDIKTLITAGIVALVVSLGAVFGLAPTNSETNLAGIASPNIYDKVKFFNTVTKGYANATSTPASLTLQSTDLNYTSLLVTPTVGAITVTLPTAANLTTVAPSVGDWVDILVVNATTTAGANITLAGNTGTTLRQASSTVALGAGQVGVLKLIRTGASTFTAYFSQAY